MRLLFLLLGPNCEIDENKRDELNKKKVVIILTNV